MIIIIIIMQLAVIFM